MGGRNRPLNKREVLAALQLLGFAYKNSSGGHDNYVATARGKFRKVTVDGHLAPFSQDLITFMACQAGLTKKEFYAAVEGMVPADWYGADQAGVSEPVEP